ERGDLGDRGWREAMLRELGELARADSRIRAGDLPREVERGALRRRQVGDVEVTLEPVDVALVVPEDTQERVLHPETVATRVVLADDEGDQVGERRRDVRHALLPEARERADEPRIRRHAIDPSRDDADRLLDLRLDRGRNARRLDDALAPGEAWECLRDLHPGSPSWHKTPRDARTTGDRARGAPAPAPVTSSPHR